MISTRTHQAVAGLDEVLAAADPEFPGSGLRRASVIRVTRLAVVAGGILHGSIGQQSAARLQSIRARLADWILGTGSP